MRLKARLILLVTCLPLLMIAAQYSAGLAALPAMGIAISWAWPPTKAVYMHALPAIVLTIGLCIFFNQAFAIAPATLAWQINPDASALNNFLITLLAIQQALTAATITLAFTTMMFGSAVAMTRNPTDPHAHDVIGLDAKILLQENLNWKQGALWSLLITIGLVVPVAGLFALGRVIKGLRKLGETVLNELQQEALDDHLAPQA